MNSIPERGQEARRHKASSVPDLVEEQHGHYGWNRGSGRLRGQRGARGSQKEKEKRGQVTQGLRSQGKDASSYLERDEMT